eukprot:7165405-Lingulodinium_polyedra.AAC.1
MRAARRALAAEAGRSQVRTAAQCLAQAWNAEVGLRLADIFHSLTRKRPRGAVATHGRTRGH